MGMKTETTVWGCTNTVRFAVLKSTGTAEWTKNVNVYRVRCHPVFVDGIKLSNITLGQHMSVSGEWLN